MRRTRSPGSNGGYGLRAVSSWKAREQSGAAAFRSLTVEDQLLGPAVLKREDLDADETGDVPRLERLSSRRVQTFRVRERRALVRIEGHRNVVEVAHGNDEES